MNYKKKLGFGVLVLVAVMLMVMMNIVMGARTLQELKDEASMVKKNVISHDPRIVVTFHHNALRPSYHSVPFPKN